MCSRKAGLPWGANPSENPFFCSSFSRCLPSSLTRLSQHFRVCYRALQVTQKTQEPLVIHSSPDPELPPRRLALPRGCTGHLSSWLTPPLSRLFVERLLGLPSLRTITHAFSKDYTKVGLPQMSVKAHKIYLRLL